MRSHVLFLVAVAILAQGESARHFVMSWPAAENSTVPAAISLNAEGRPEGRFQCFPGSSPAKIRPGRPFNGPEALLRNIAYVVWQTCSHALTHPPRPAKPSPEVLISSSRWEGRELEFLQTTLGHNIL